MKNIQNLTLFLKKNFYLAVAGELIFAIVLTSISFGNAFAAQLTGRSITMSDSGFSGGTITSGVGSGTNVVYRIQFTFPAATAIAGVAIDFCTNSAIAGESCTAPAGFNINRSTTSIATQTGIGAGTMAIKTASETLNNRIIITRGSAAAVVPATPADIVFGNGTTNGFTNPNSNGTFYARIYTYTSQAGANAHNTAAATGYLDNGGIALSIANVITITARVQETLTFCVSLVAPGANCSGTSTPAVTLGHGTVPTIDSTVVDTNSAYTQVSTNATDGATVRMHNAYACGGLSADGGATCGIPAAGSGAGTAAAIAAGTAAFGLYAAPGSGGSGTVTPDSNYYNASHSTIATDLWYGMDTTTGGSNTVTTYGDSILSSSAPVSNVNNRLVFAATASNVTPAGVYITNLSLIATGLF